MKRPHVGWLAVNRTARRDCRCCVPNQLIVIGNCVIGFQNGRPTSCGVARKIIKDGHATINRAPTLGVLNWLTGLIACQSLASCPGLANGSFRIKVILRTKPLWQATDWASRPDFVYIQSCRGYGYPLQCQVQCNPNSYYTQEIDIFWSISYKYLDSGGIFCIVKLYIQHRWKLDQFCFQHLGHKHICTRYDVAGKIVQRWSVSNRKHMLPPDITVRNHTGRRQAGWLRPALCGVEPITGCRLAIRHLLPSTWIFGCLVARL